MSGRLSGSAYSCSPHPRGWSHQLRVQRHRLHLLPAPAGMVPSPPGRDGCPRAAPRTRGDGPRMLTVPRRHCLCSPHPRGWSRLPDVGQLVGVLLPAPAGMVPGRARDPRYRVSAPRTRGDGPEEIDGIMSGLVCSPHPRGWSPAQRLQRAEGGLLPAPAGMVPPRPHRHRRHRPAPRTSGDGPLGNGRDEYPAVCSPHPRGWSRPPLLGRDVFALLPAPAGMVPTCVTTTSPAVTAPRTRGDGPAHVSVQPVAVHCSPHPRGWSLRRDRSGHTSGLLPAPAGMVPPRANRAGAANSAPRTRGDGPHDDLNWREIAHCSPHPRGWSRRVDRCGLPHHLLPAPAGMVPRRAGRRAPARSAPRTRGDGPPARQPRRGG